MFVLRFFAGPIVHKVSPLGLLAICSAIAAIGLYMLSVSAGVMILVAATIYGLGKTFFWPTMLGVVAERFPKGGALTLNITGGLGMIAAGVIGAGILGFIQDKSVDKNIQPTIRAIIPAMHSSYVTENKTSFFGDYKALDQEKLATASDRDNATVTGIRDSAKKECIERYCHISNYHAGKLSGLIIYFRSKGGYKAVVLNKEPVPNLQRIN